MSRYFKQKPAIRALFIEEGLKPHTISARYKNRPTAQAIRNWSLEVDEHGKTWEDYRQEYQDELFLLNSSTRSIANKIIIRIHQLLDDPHFSTKSTDALAKLQKTMESVVDPKYHVGMLFTFLEDYLTFTKDHYSDLINERFLALARDYKNHIRDRGGLELPTNP